VRPHYEYELYSEKMTEPGVGAEVGAEGSSLKTDRRVAPPHKQGKV
jgi:hypothetical protein